MREPQPLCFHANDYVPLAEAHVGVGSLALRYALSVFEGIRLYRREDGEGLVALAWAAHVERLRRSCRLMGLPEPGLSRLPEIVAELVARNRIQDDAYVRPSVTAVNVGDLGTQPETALTVTVSPMGRKPWLAREKAMRLMVSGWQRPHDLSFPTAAKCVGNYAGPFVAAARARAAGFDGVLLLSPDGLIAEAPTATLFIVRDGRLTTPRLTDSVLPSITRALVFDIARELGIDCAEGPVSRTDLYNADEAFLCGTGLEFGPIASVDGFELLEAEERPVTRRLVARYFERARRAADGWVVPMPSSGEAGRER